MWERLAFVYFTTNIRIHFAEHSLEAFGVVVLYLVDIAEYAVVALYRLSNTLTLAPFAHNFCFLTVMGNMRQMSLKPLVKLAISTVIDARCRFNEAGFPVLESLIEGVNLVTVFTQHFQTLEFTFEVLGQFSFLENFTTLGDGALSALRQIRSGTCTTEAVRAV